MKSEGFVLEKDTKALRGFVMKVVKTLGRKDVKFVTFKKAIGR